MFSFSTRPKRPKEILAGSPDRMKHNGRITGPFDIGRCSTEDLRKIAHEVDFSSDRRALYQLAGVNWFFFKTTYKTRVARWVQTQFSHMNQQAQIFAKEEYLARVLGMIEYLEQLSSKPIPLEIRRDGLLQLIKTMEWDQLPESYVCRVCEWILDASKVDELQSEGRLRIRLKLAVKLAAYHNMSRAFNFAVEPLERISLSVDDLDQDGKVLLQLVCHAHIYRFNFGLEGETIINGQPCRELFDHALGSLKALPEPMQLLALPELGIAARDNPEKIEQVLSLLKPLSVPVKTQVLLSWFRPGTEEWPAGLLAIPNDSALNLSSAGWDILAPGLKELLDAIEHDESLPRASLLCHVAEALSYWHWSDLDKARVLTLGSLLDKLVGQCLQLYQALQGSESRLDDLMARTTRAVLWQMRCAAKFDVASGVELKRLWFACFDETGCATDLLQTLLIACVESGLEHPAVPEIQQLAEQSPGAIGSKMVQLGLQAWSWQPGQENTVDEGLAIVNELSSLPHELAQVVAFEMLGPIMPPVQVGRRAAAPPLDRRLVIALSSISAWLSEYSVEQLINGCAEADLGEVLANMLRHAVPAESAQRLVVLCAIGIALVRRKSLHSSGGRFFFEAVLQTLSQLPEPQRSLGLSRMLDKIRHSQLPHDALEAWFDSFLRELAMTSAEHKGSLLLSLGKMLPKLPVQRRAAALADLLDEADTMPQASRQAWRLACRALAVDTACAPEQAEAEFEKCEIIMEECSSLPDNQQIFLIQLCDSRMVRLQTGDEDSVGDVDDYLFAMGEQRHKLRQAHDATAGSEDEDDNNESEDMSLERSDGPGPSDSVDTGDLADDEMTLDKDDAPNNADDPDDMGDDRSQHD